MIRWIDRCLTEQAENPLKSRQSIELTTMKQSFWVIFLSAQLVSIQLHSQSASDITDTGLPNIPCIGYYDDMEYSRGFGYGVDVDKDSSIAKAFDSAISDVIWKMPYSYNYDSATGFSSKQYEEHIMHILKKAVGSVAKKVCMSVNRNEHEEYVSYTAIQVYHETLHALYVIAQEMSKQPKK